MLNIDNEVLKDFLIEANEHLESAENQIIKLEKNSKDADTLNQLFGAIHSIKGAAGYLGVMSVHDLAHEFESVLEKLRRGKISVTTESYDLLFKGMDGLKRAVRKIESGSEEEDTSALIQAFKEFGSIESTSTNPKADAATVKKSPAETPKSTQSKTTLKTKPNDDGVEDFIQEASEHLNTIEQALLEIEKRPNASDAVDRMLRAVHSLKGSSGYLGLQAIHDLAHAFESGVTNVRKTGTRITLDLIEVLLQSLDTMKLGVRMAEENRSKDFSSDDMIRQLLNFGQASKKSVENVKSVNEENSILERKSNNKTVTTPAAVSVTGIELPPELKDEAFKIIQTLEKITGTPKKKNITYADELLENLSLQAEYHGYDAAWDAIRNIHKNFKSSKDVIRLKDDIQRFMGVSGVGSVKSTKNAKSDAVIINEITDEEYDALFGDYDTNMSAIAATTLENNIQTLREYIDRLDDRESRKQYTAAIERLLTASRYLDALWLQTMLSDSMSVLKKSGNGIVDQTSFAHIKGHFGKLESLLARWKSKQDVKSNQESRRTESTTPIIEDDQELLDIFFDNCKEHMRKMNNLLSEANRRGLSTAEAADMKNSIGRLSVSANYMDFKVMIEDLKSMDDIIELVVKGDEIALNGQQISSLTQTLRRLDDFVVRVTGKTRDDIYSTSTTGSAKASKETEQVKPVSIKQAVHESTPPPPVKESIKPTAQKPVVESAQLNEVFHRELEDAMRIAHRSLSMICGQSGSNEDFERVLEALQSVQGTLDFLKHTKGKESIEAMLYLVEPVVKGHAEKIQPSEMPKLITGWNQLVEYCASKLKHPEWKQQWTIQMPIINEATETPAPSASIEATDIDRRAMPRRRVEDQVETEETMAAAMRAQQTIRVETTKIDDLMTLVGELVVNRSSFIQLGEDFKKLYQEVRSTSEAEKKFLRLIKDFSLKVDSTTLGLGRITNDLQDKVMRVRMIPISQLFNRFPRMVRELARMTDKKVDLELHGEDTELDKTVIEQIADPMIHLIRNSIDHGIESPEVRQKAGKHGTGKLSLRAFHESNQIVVEVEDDGAGLNLEKIAQRAVERNLISKSEAQLLSKKEMMELIFKPNFSTSDRVSEISGRGIGMDVVKRNIEKLNGTIAVDSEPGRGSKITVRIPLTLAIIKALLVRVADQTYCIPLTSVVETLRITTGDISTIEQHEVLKYREKVIALLRLSELFGVESDRTHDEHRFVVVVNPGGKEIGLVIDAPVGEHDIVIKPLEEAIISTPGVSGAAILGGGEITLILDIPALSDLAINRKIHLRRELDARRELV